MYAAFTAADIIAIIAAVFSGITGTIAAIGVVLVNLRIRTGNGHTIGETAHATYRASKDALDVVTAPPEPTPAGAASAGLAPPPVVTDVAP